MKNNSRKDVTEIVSVLTRKEQDVLGEIIRSEGWSGYRMHFLDENCDVVTDGAYAYPLQNWAHSAARRELMLIYRKLCPLHHQTGLVISHRSDYFGIWDGEDVLFLREGWHEPFFEWAWELKEESLGPGPAATDDEVARFVVEESQAENPDKLFEWAYRLEKERRADEAAQRVMAESQGQGQPRNNEPAPASEIRLADP